MSRIIIIIIIIIVIIIIIIINIIIINERCVNAALCLHFTSFRPLNIVFLLCDTKI